MRIKEDKRIDGVIRGSSLADFKLDAVSISQTVLSLSPTGISTSYVASEVQAVADAVAELRKILV